LRGYQSFSLDSPNFPELRSDRSAYVDKTGAIADLLMSEDGMRRRRRIFFARPRKFGKSLTLSVAAEMLAAGELPPGVKPWPSFQRVDVDACFGGLAVHERLRASDASLGGLLQRAHFVVKLGLGEAQTGAKLEGDIFDGIARIAGTAFGDALKAEVRLASSPGKALGVLVSAVPLGVPVAVLVDEYDASIIRDVSKSRWAAAEAGVDALRSLMIATKSPDIGPRISRCLVTGVARFAQASLFSGANNFADLTGSPLLSRVLGFSESEIRASFPEELKRLAAGLGVSTDAAMAELARLYNGYCFDGISSSFNPFPVLVALRDGTVSMREMEASSGTDWLGLRPAALLQRLAEDLQLRPGLKSSSESFDIANLEAQTVAVVPLLLQTGLLSAVPGQPQLCRPPNAYARQSLERMMATATAATTASIPHFTAALELRDRAAFTALLHLVFADLPVKMLPHTEASYHSNLFCSLRWSAPSRVAVRTEVAQRSGSSDIVIEFSGPKGTIDTVWILEIGIDTPVDLKMLQSLRYAENLGEEVTVLCCAMSIDKPVSASVSARQGNGKAGAAVSVIWEQRTKAGPPPVWKALP
jgi:hypothetical protein